MLLSLRKKIIILVCLLSTPWILHLKNIYIQEILRKEQVTNLNIDSSRTRNVSAIWTNEKNLNLNMEILRKKQVTNLEILSSRTRNVSAFCTKEKKLNLNKVPKGRMSNKLPRDLLIMPEKRLAWCMVPKAASTSISTAIVEINNQTSLLEDITQTQVFLRKVYKKVNLEIFRSESASYISFYITRHPFYRIVAAYRNKLEISSVHDGEYFYKRYGKKIVNTYRNKTLQYNKKEPTFKEFVDYLLHTKSNNYDLHWQPISMLCDVCNYRYNFTIKFENFRSEFQTLLTYLKEGKFLPVEFEMKWKNKGTDDEKKDEITRTYMKQIPRHYVKRLYEIYKADFTYFGYDSGEY